MRAVSENKQLCDARQAAFDAELLEFMALSPNLKLRLLMEVLDMCWARDAHRQGNQPADVFSSPSANP